MNIRVWSVLLTCMVIVEANANDEVSKQHPDLQVGAPLRLDQSDKKTVQFENGGHLDRTHRIEPQYGESSSLSRVLNVDGELLVDLESQEVDDVDMGYDVSSSLSVGVDYDFIEAEDQSHDVAAVRGIDADHQSHNVLFRAQWHFR